MTNGIRIRSRGEWFEQKEKPTKAFLLHIVWKQRNWPYWITSSTKAKQSSHSQQQNLNGINLPKFSDNEIKLCQASITKKCRFEILKSVHENKSSENDVLAKTFYETFQHNLTQQLLNSLPTSF